jgi:hypothetical protein
MEVCRVTSGVPPSATPSILSGVAGEARDGGGGETGGGESERGTAAVDWPKRCLAHQ